MSDKGLRSWVEYIVVSVSHRKEINELDRMPVDEEPDPEKLVSRREKSKSERQLERRR